MEPIVITVDFPPPQLHAHNKGHWRSKAKHVRAFRDAAREIAEPLRPEEPLSRALLSYDIFYPAKRRYDLTNTVQSLKPAIDGLVDAGIMDDDNWMVMQIGHIRGHLDRESPRVQLTVSDASHL